MKKMKPKRIQRRRVKGWTMPKGAIYVGRPSKYGNPMHVGMFRGFTRADAVEHFERWLNGDVHINVPQGPLHGKKLAADAKVELRGKDLACWCSLSEKCHADVLLKLANS